VLRLAADLMVPGQRLEAAQALARHFGAEDLIVFIPDQEAGLLLPAPGFPRTLQSFKTWQALLAEAREPGLAHGHVPHGAGEPRPAMALAAARAVLVLIGGAPDPGQVDRLRLLFPLLAAAFHGDQAARDAAADARAARQAVEDSGALTRTLDETRRTLQATLVEADAARRQAELANRAKDEFLATLSHELRTPLTAIIGWSHLLLRGELTAAESTRAVETIHRNAMVQNNLVSDILDLSRIIAGKVRLNVSTITLGDVIKAALDTVRPTAEAKGVELVATIDPSVGSIPGDADRLQQVFWNLLSNAVKFSPAGQQIEIRLTRSTTGAVAMVADSGPGVEPGLLPYVFDRFRQAESSANRAHKGLGLGLAIVRQLVELHGGSVRASNRPEGGALFTVELPRRAPAVANDALMSPVVGEAAEDEMSLGAAPRLEGVRVLIVEDQEDSREALKALFEHLGAEVTTAASAAEGLRCIRTERPHVLVSDIGMPEEDGYSLLQKVRELPPHEGGLTPAVALTAFISNADRMKALAGGFQMHVPKPVHPVEIATAVASLAGVLRTV
jgi:signal transduction histidine kinase/ActR/RegA family two-component response regulator